MARKYMTIEENVGFSIGKSKPRKNASKLHKLAVRLVKEISPHSIIREEVSVKISQYDKAKSFLDILVDDFLVLEPSGRQHYEYIKHFHKTKKNFLKAQHKDRQKMLWCEINGLDFLELPYYESEEEWRVKIVRAIQS